jgi:uncharacterized membrane protein YhaH (DUF805 family)
VQGGRKVFGQREGVVRRSREVARRNFDLFGSNADTGHPDASAQSFWTEHEAASREQGVFGSLRPVFHLFFGFRGRITRFSYWLASTLVTLLMVVAVLRLPDLHDPAKMYTTPVGVFANLAFGYVYAAIAAKRWHDRDKSGWWSLISFVPVLGPLWAVFELGSLPGNPGSNKYG